jgi:hypothetical protein
VNIKQAFLNGENSMRNRIMLALSSILLRDDYKKEIINLKNCIDNAYSSKFSNILLKNEDK